MSTIPLRQEPAHGGVIQVVHPEGLAAALGLEPGDELLAINGHRLRDVIDVRFYGAEEDLELLVRQQGELVLYEVERDYEEPLGIEFTHPTFDIDIRRCNNLCEFCFVLQTAPGMRRTLYIKDDDYRYSFLQGHYVTLTNLSQEDWARIEEQHLSPLYVSVHATALDLRRKILRNPEAPDIMAQLRWLGERGIQTHTQIVVTPGLNDGQHLDRSIADLATLWPAVRSVSVVPVGITSHHKYGHRPHTQPEARQVMQQVRGWQIKFQGELGIRFAYLTDEWYLRLEQPPPPLEAYDGLALEENGLGMLRAFLDDWAALKEALERQEGTATGPDPAADSQVTMVTGTLFGPTLAETATEFARLTGTSVQVIPVVNQRLGASITVAGLLMGRDVLDELNKHALGDFVFLPRTMFNYPHSGGITLDDVSQERISHELERPIVLAERMSDVWAAMRGENAGA